MPIVHQDHGFDFIIKPEDKEPPKVHVTGAGGKYLLVRVGIPGQDYPYIEKYEKVDQDEVNQVWDTIADYQENFLVAWKRIHGGEWKTARGPVKLGPRIEPAAGVRLCLKPKVNKERLKELIGAIHDKRFYRLKKLLIWDIDRAEFKSISLVLYLRLGGWSHTGSTYVGTMEQVRGICKAMFGYELPEKIGKFFLKGYRYRAGKGLATVGAVVSKYHERVSARIV